MGYPTDPMFSSPSDRASALRKEAHRATAPFFPRRVEGASCRRVSSLSTVLNIGHPVVTSSGFSTSLLSSEEEVAGHSPHVRGEGLCSTSLGHRSCVS